MKELHRGVICKLKGEEDIILGKNISLHVINLLSLWSVYSQLVKNPSTYIKILPEDMSRHGTLLKKNKSTKLDLFVYSV